MKKVTALFLALMFIISTFGIQNVSAADQSESDEFDWNNLRAEYEYNSSRDEVDLEIFLPNINNTPESLCTLELEVNNRIFDERMTYSSSRDEISVNFLFEDIDSSELENYLSLDIIIMNDTRQEVFNGRIEMSGGGSTDNNSDDLNWRNLDVWYTYNESSERLIIAIDLPEVRTRPRFDYTVEVESNNRVYNEIMEYSSSSDELQARISISNVDERDLQDYFDVEILIEDDENTVVFREDIDLERGFSGTTSSDNSNDNNSSNSNVDWDDLEFSVVYERDENRLNVAFEIDGINEFIDPSDYVLSLNFDGRRYELAFLYSEINKSIFAFKYVPVFTAWRVDSTYNVVIIIRDENGNTVHSETQKVTTNRNGDSTNPWAINAELASSMNSSTNTTSSSSTTDESSSSNTNTSSSTNTTTNSELDNEIEVTAFRYIQSVEQRFVSPIARAAFLNRTIDALEATRFSLDARVVDGIIAILEERIVSYNNWTANTINTWNTNFESSSTKDIPPVRTPTKVNKAESIRSDGKGWTFKYVGGYNY